MATQPRWTHLAAIKMNCQRKKEAFCLAVQSVPTSVSAAAWYASGSDPVFVQCSQKKASVPLLRAGASDSAFNGSMLSWSKET